jgi:hypothetical protein
VQPTQCIEGTEILKVGKSTATPQLFTAFLLELLRVAVGAPAPAFAFEVRVLFLLLAALTGGGGDDGSGDTDATDEVVDNLDDRRAGVFSGLGFVEATARVLRVGRDGGKGATWSSS